MPGPAFYFSKKAAENFKLRIMNKNKLEVPFGSYESKDLQNILKITHQSPGPGAYIDINDPCHSCLGKVLN